MNLIKIAVIFLLISLTLFAGIFAWGEGSKIKLRDMEVLTLYENKYTNSRRGPSIPQLKCLGGSGGCRETPHVVQCKNSGFDGHEVQWECKAQLPNHLIFGRLNVNCEGYDYPGDKYVLQGSCGLEYYLENSKGKGNYYPSDYSMKSSRMANLIGIAIICLVIYGFYRSCLHQPQYSPTDDYSNPRPGSGYRPSTSAPPPPGFRSDYYQGTDSCSGNGRNQNSSGGGFWSGAATGGLLGYLFGRNNSDGYSRGHNNYSSGWGSGWGSGDTWGSSRQRSRSRSNDASHSATGYGGTTVR